MDFLKALMLYMSLTFAGAVDAAPVPELTATPVPSPTPTAIVETVTPEVTEVPATETPVPVATREPKPTITPGKGYVNLSYGSKGKEVKKLQERLAELGYLTGSVDGAYGYQTKNAVIKFQKYNNLTADGVAGRMTQTILFEDPDVMVNPELVTPTPEPTATPVPEGSEALEEDPVAVWGQPELTVLLNGKVLEPAPRVWQRGDTLLFSLEDMDAACGWSLTAEGAEEVRFTCAGYPVSAVMRADPAIQTDPESGTVFHCETYQVTSNGEPVEAIQGDLIYFRGSWYISDMLLTRVCGGELKYDSEENAVLLKIMESGFNGTEG